MHGSDTLPLLTALLATVCSAFQVSFPSIGMFVWQDILGALQPTSLTWCHPMNHLPCPVQSAI